MHSWFPFCYKRKFPPLSPICGRGNGQSRDSFLLDSLRKWVGEWTNVTVTFLKRANKRFIIYLTFLFNMRDHYAVGVLKREPRPEGLAPGFYFFRFSDRRESLGYNMGCWPRARMPEISILKSATQCFGTSAAFALPRCISQRGRIIAISQ